MNMSHSDLSTVAKSFQSAMQGVERRIIICAGTGCVANGALKVQAAFVERIGKAGLKALVELQDEKPDGGILVSKSGCHGFCQLGPLVTILPDEILYTRVSVDDVAEIVDQTLKKGKAVDRLLYLEPGAEKRSRKSAEITFYNRQKKTILQNCGLIDPEDIREYIAHDGYEAARKAFLDMSPEAICTEMIHSGLRGRGGGGFPTGKKWDLARIQPGPKKYIICNGDEGDPGAFMDQGVMEGNPHSVLEGMMIAARAIGADEGIVYVRAEYPRAVKRMRQAVLAAKNSGLLGKNIFESGIDFSISVMEGAGAFVCGEETAMIASIEGKRGMPSPKPPFPAQSGLFGKPTIINNVETLSTVPHIIRKGAAWFRSIGTETSPGTKTFALTGHIVNTGLIEVPMGTTLREIVYSIGGGVTGDDGKITGAGFKAVQIGGPSGGCLTEEHLDLPLDFDSLRGVGAMVGSGGLVVMNRESCMVKVARFFMGFTQNESCGKCLPCREGTRQLLNLLDDIIEGRADARTLENLESLAIAVGKASLCGLGKTAPNPVLSTMRRFRAEYEAHVFQKRCPTNSCKALKTLSINPDKCKGCTLCARQCPVDAIKGAVKKPHVIDTALCIKCQACVTACKFDAVI